MEYDYMELIDQEMQQDLLDIIQEQFEQEVLKLFDEYEMKQEYSSYFNHTL